MSESKIGIKVSSQNVPIPKRTRLYGINRARNLTRGHFALDTFWLGDVLTGKRRKVACASSVSHKILTAVPDHWCLLTDNVQLDIFKAEAIFTADPNRYRRSCPDPNARIQKFYTLYRNTAKEFT